MNREDSPLRFVEERLGRKRGARLHLRRPERLTRRFAVRMRKGEAHCFERVDSSVELRCAQGSLWITHDGDPKDVILSSQEGYRAQREDAMHVFALQPCVVEIEFEDDAIPEH